MVNVIDYLSEEDLDRYRWITAIEGMLMGGRSDVPLEEAAQRITEGWEFLGEIRRRYDIDPDQSFDVRVYDGALVEVD